ncbi:hypothetical protein ACPOL_3119 [Acidisarcina polymorpha]|uniref:Uncharacterized protein n=1 Tax=Acidisarcina polymorpha TaxID=2211140 RepID=A0A2Z5G0W1_9BACT|nr:hypothetical protein [Acidisarcina polymorpha]AXC12414.1 hypothetical protein ACPOL_3119 [Acidisarcina polymorpha]
MASRTTAATQDVESKGKEVATPKGKAVIVGSSLLFGILQSICPVVVAMNGL